MSKRIIQAPVIRAAPLMLAIIYAACVMMRLDRRDIAGATGLFASYGGAILSLVILALLLRLLLVLRQDHRDGVDRPLGALVRARFVACWQEDRGASVWLPPLTFTILLAAFTSYKQRILPQAGFGFGPKAAAVDHWLLGRDAWQVTHALLPGPGWSQAIDLAYHLWFAPMTLGVVLCAMMRPGSALAWRYLTTYALDWVVQGSLLAWLMPSAGPCFFHRFQADHSRFLPLLRELRAHDTALDAAGWPGLSALDYQDQLIRLYNGGELALGGGISAMPSLHNAMAILFACAAFHCGRRIGLVFAGYAGVIWIGSIHLGWHYAIDGVVALAVSMCLWKLTGVVAHHAGGRGGAPLPLALPQLIPAVAQTED